MKETQILLVDDEQAILQMVEMVLKKEGFHHIHTAETGAEALQIVKTTPLDYIVLDVMLPDTNGFDYIVLDVMLPDTNGFDLCMRIREYTDVHVLFLTARVTD